jgi:chaperonin GroES
MTIRMTGEWLLVERMKPEETSPGGIALPVKAVKNEGIVKAAGPGRTTDKGIFIPMQIKVGERVIFTRYAGEKVTAGQEQLLLVKESDVLAIVEECE